MTNQQTDDDSLRGLVADPFTFAEFPCLRLARMRDENGLPDGIIAAHWAAVKVRFTNIGLIIGMRLSDHGFGDILQKFDIVLRVVPHKQPVISICPWCKAKNVSPKYVHPDDFQMSRGESLRRSLATDCDHQIPASSEEQLVIQNLQAYDNHPDRFPEIAAFKTLPLKTQVGT